MKKQIFVLVEDKPAGSFTHKSLQKTEDFLHALMKQNLHGDVNPQKAKKSFFKRICQPFVWFWHKVTGLDLVKK